MASSQREMTEIHFRGVESQLITSALRSQYLQTENRKIPHHPALAPSDKFEVDRYVDAAVQCLRYFGIDVPDRPSRQYVDISVGLSASTHIELMDDLELLARLNATLGTPIRRIITYNGNPFTVVFDTESSIFTANSFFSLTRLRKACLKGTGHEIPYLPKEVWEVVCQAIVRLHYSYDLMPFPRRKSINPEVLIGAYLALNPALEVPGIFDSPLEPFIHKRRTYVPPGHFEDWHRLYRQKKAGSADIWAGLRARGWNESIEDVRVDGKVRPVKFWVSPFKWSPRN